MQMQVVLPLLLVLSVFTPSIACAQAATKAKTSPREASKESFTVVLFEATKPRQVFMPFLNPDGNPNPQPHPPHPANIQAVRLIRSDRPDELLIRFDGVYWPEPVVRKIVQFKKDFDKNRLAVPEHVDNVHVRLECGDTVIHFNLRTGQCESAPYQVPDGFFDALADALGDLQKLQAGKPSFRVK